MPRVVLCFLAVLPLAGCLDGPAGHAGPSPPPARPGWHDRWELGEAGGDRAFLIHLAFGQTTGCRVDLALSGAFGGAAAGLVSSSWLGPSSDWGSPLTENWTTSFVSQAYGAQANGVALPLAIEQGGLAWEASIHASATFQAGQTFVWTLLATRLQPFDGTRSHLDLSCDRPVDARLHGGRDEVLTLAPGRFGQGVGAHSPQFTACDEQASLPVASPTAFVQVFHDPRLQEDTPVLVNVTTANVDGRFSFGNAGPHSYGIVDSSGEVTASCRYAGPSPTLVLGIAGVHPVGSLAQVG